MKTFADNLRAELHKLVPAAILKQNPSGFHICGYNASQLPEFWSLTNVGGLKGYNHVDFKSRYGSPSSDFLERDAKQTFGWDGIDPASAKSGVLTYRNGDFRSHVAAWESLDEIFSRLLQFPDFRRPTDPQTYGEYVKFKFEVVAYIYKKWARKQIIARPLDVIVLSKDVHG